MRTIRPFWIGAIFVFGAVFAGCSGGGGGNSTTIPSPSHTGVQSSQIRKVTIKLVVPGSSAAQQSNQRSPKYVSAATTGVVITSAVPSGGGSIDGVSFSTSIADNPYNAATGTGCSYVSGTSGPVSCAFTIGALSPSTTFVVTTYDKEPSVPTGGAPANEPTTANLLSEGTTTATIQSGSANTVSVPLSGVAASFTLSAPVPTATTFSAASTAVISAPGQNAPTTFVFSYVANDADGFAISTTTAALANPLTLSLTEKNAGTGKNAVSFSSIGLNAVAAKSLTASSSSTTDTFSVQYSGATGPVAAPYYVTMASSASGVGDPNGISPTSAPPAVVTVSIDPLFVTTGTLQKGDTFATPAPTSTTYPTLSYGKQTGTAYSTISILTNAQATAGTYSPMGVANGPSPTYAANTCSGFAFPAKKAPIYNATFPGNATPTSGTPCIFGFGDGESTVYVNAAYLATSGGGTIIIPGS